MWPTEFGDFAFAQSGVLNATRLGYTFGGGVEHAIGNNWSVKAEYLHYDFGRATATQVQSTDLNQLTTQSAELKADMVRLGLNYRFGAADTAAASPRLFDSAGESASIWNASNWEFDVGTRAFFSNGLDGNRTLSSIHRTSSPHGCSGAISTRSPEKPMVASIMQAAGS